MSRSSLDRSTRVRRAGSARTHAATGQSTVPPQNAGARGSRPSHPGSARPRAKRALWSCGRCAASCSTRPRAESPYKPTARKHGKFRAPAGLKFGLTQQTGKPLVTTLDTASQPIPWKAVDPARELARASERTAGRHDERNLLRGAEWVQSCLELTLPLNLLHLSDIHFQYRLDGTIHDLDHDVRNELAIDLQQVVNQSGNIHGIVVTGDVAFAGKSADYDAAQAWLSSLCKRIGCDAEHVWVVPGNHDVDRARVTPLVRTVQDSIQEAAPRDLDTQIRRFIHDDPSGAAVLEGPLSAYYKFSSIYRCKPRPGNLSWTYDLPLGMGYTLRLVGLNSALLSNGDDDKTTRPLVVGQAQLLMPRQSGYVYASLCHHPMSWLKDGQTVHTKLCGRASLQLFGHVHEPALQQVDTSLIVQAGALHPDRHTDGPWRPTYNVLTLQPHESATGHHLSVTAYPRVWSTNHRFSTEPTLGEQEYQRFTLMLDKAICLRNVTHGRSPNDGGTAAAAPFPNAADDTQQESDMANPVRQLAYAFLTLPYSAQLRIANTLSLLEDADAGLDCAALFERIYERASDHNCLAPFWDLVREAQDDVAMMPNPYRTVPASKETHHG